MMAHFNSELRRAFGAIISVTNLRIAVIFLITTTLTLTLALRRLA